MEDVFTNVMPLLHVQVGGQTIRTTTEHPFYVRGKGWVAAKDLQNGDSLRSHDGQWVSVDSVAEGEGFAIEDYRNEYPPRIGTFWVLTMARRSSKRPQIGDILEIKTSRGLAYALYSHEHKNYGSLLRVFSGTYSERPPDLSALVEGMPLFTHFFPLFSELKHKDTPFSIVGHVELPNWAIPFPVFRNGLPDREGITHEWWLWDGEKEWKVGKLSSEEIRSYPDLGVFNLPAIIQMIENGWSSWDPVGRNSINNSKVPWHMRSKEQPHQMFQMQPVEQADYPGRSDLFVGYSVIPAFWERYHSAEALDSSDFSTCGEIFCYLKIDGINGLEGSVFADKSQIEDTLDEALRHFNVGCVIGSGTGLRYSYVDFAVTDFPMASGIIRKVLCAGKIPKRSWILFFDSDKAGQWIGIWDDSPAPPQ